MHDDTTITPYSFFPEVHASLDAAGFKHVTLKTMEADDLLASGAQALKKKSRVFLAVKDKDVMQAVDTTVTQYWPAQQQREAEEITPKDVKRIRGVLPVQMPELQILVGDPTDDIPNIRDIKLKKAKKILSEYATVAEAMRSKEYGPDLKPYAKQIALNRQLVTLRTDCWKPSLRDVQVGPLKIKALVNMFGRVPTGVEEFHAQLQLRSTKGLFR
jgi:DNA polymerase-1